MKLLTQLYNISTQPKAGGLMKHPMDGDVVLQRGFQPTQGGKADKTCDRLLHLRGKG
ncbi:hypothetical protein NDA03_06055 [Trichocoleus sp. Lan]|uniref:hypothetical protein n=1 Tax=Trichocoleus sp. Lan TaxID=2933927 RepID=UPI003297AA4F